jgi:hypothetical protein
MCGQIQSATFLKEFSNSIGGLSPFDECTAPEKLREKKKTDKFIEQLNKNKMLYFNAAVV